MKRTRRNHGATFKAQGRAAVKGDKTAEWGGGEGGGGGGAPHRAPEFRYQLFEYPRI